MTRILSAQFQTPLALHILSISMDVTIHWCNVIYYIMTGCAFAVAKEVFYHRNGNILTSWEWLNDEKQVFQFKFNSINKHLYLEKNFKHLRLRHTTIFSQNVHWWANQAWSWLLRILPLHIIWIYQFIRQLLSFPLYDTHPTWLSLTNELKLAD